MPFSLRVHRITSLFYVIVAALSLCGCGKDKEVSYKSNGITQTFRGGNAANTRDFPLPVYPNSKPSGEVQAGDDAEDHSQFLMLLSSDKMDQVSSYYYRELQAQGWKIEQTVKQPSIVNIGAKKGKLEGSVMISADETGQTTISIAVSEVSEGTPKLSGEAYVPNKFNPPTD